MSVAIVLLIISFLLFVAAAFNISSGTFHGALEPHPTPGRFNLLAAGLAFLALSELIARWPA